MPLRISLLAAATILALAPPAQAHHSFAMFDAEKTITMAGTLKELEWTNPHAWIRITAVDLESGQAMEWSFEMGSPAQLSSRGMKADSVKPGDKVTVRFHPMKDGTHGGQYMSVTLADGHVFGQAAPQRRKRGNQEARATTLGSILSGPFFGAVQPIEPRGSPQRIQHRRTIMNPYLTVEGVRVKYAEQVAVDDLSLAVNQGEFLTLLGPSGCGKTTTLRCIAGFVPPARGRVLVGGRDITSVPAHRRNFGMVFQSYALFPHLTAEENVAFGLRMRHVQSSERRRRARDALQMVGLSQAGDRYPAQLSGGQQQRVALARALVIEPQLLLLDEPLSNLDANLRAELRAEIRALQSRLMITTILVTHDQQEALAVSDRIVIMNEGRIVDSGTPEELCDAPRDAFAAAFMGGRTVIPGHTRDGVFEAPGLTCREAPQDATRIVLRGPRLRLNGVGGPLVVNGRIASRTYLGDTFEIDVETSSGVIRAVVPSEEPPPMVGQPCLISALPGGVSFIRDECRSAGWEP